MWGFFMATAKRDQNRVPTLIGVSTTDDETPINVAVNPVTKALITESGTASTSNYTWKITETGSFSYIAKAAIGTAQSANEWQVYRVDESTGTIILWADGNADFDNVATDLTALSYS
jgi:hypothetical protein